MKVLIYSHYFLPSFGGVEKTTFLLARYLQENGHEATVVTRIPAVGEDGWSFRVIRNPGIKQLVAEIKRADVVHLQGFVLLLFLLAKVVGRPIAWAHHGYDLTCPKQIGWKDGQDTSFRFSQCVECLRRDHSTPETFGLILLLLLKRLFRPFADAHIAPSRYLLEREGLRGTVIPNAVDTQLYAPGKEERVQRQVLFVGRLIEEKGVAVLLEAIDLLTQRGRDYNLEIVGDGYKRNEIHRLVKQMGLEGRVSFASSISEMELVRRVCRASVVCAPTLNAEPFGIVGLEVMSCGTPLIASDTGGFPEFAEGVALLTPPGDVFALVEALEQATSENNSLSKRTEMGRQRMLDLYDYRRIGRAYTRLYGNIIRSQGG